MSEEPRGQRREASPPLLAMPFRLLPPDRRRNDKPQRLAGGTKSGPRHRSCPPPARRKASPPRDPRPQSSRRLPVACGGLGSTGRCDRKTSGRGKSSRRPRGGEDVLRVRLRVVSLSPRRGLRMSYLISPSFFGFIFVFFFPIPEHPLTG